MANQVYNALMTIGMVFCAVFGSRSLYDQVLLNRIKTDINHIRSFDYDHKLYSKDRVAFFKQYNQILDSFSTNRLDIYYLVQRNHLDHFSFTSSHENCRKTLRVFQKMGNYVFEIERSQIDNDTFFIIIEQSNRKLFHNLLNSKETQQVDSDADLTSDNFHSGVGGYAALSTPAFQSSDAVR